MAFDLFLTFDDAGKNISWTQDDLLLGAKIWFCDITIISRQFNLKKKKRTLNLPVERRLTQKQNFAYLGSKAHFILVLVNLFLQQFDQEIENTRKQTGQVQNSARRMVIRS